jgi:YfiH family protein
MKQRRFSLESEVLHSRHGFSLKTGNEQDYVEEAGFSRPPVILKQVHGDTILRIDQVPSNILEADALITNQDNLPIGVVTADCVPILIEDRKTGAVAAIHAGWRGTAKRIVQKAVDALQREYHSDPADLVAAIGPAIGACCFEIGPEVAEDLKKLPGGDRCLTRKEKFYADLKSLIAYQLEEVGVRALDQTEHCTRCNEELFYSYRRNGPEAGRMIAAIQK